MFYLLIPTVTQIHNWKHARLHTNRAHGNFKQQEAKFKSQFDQRFCTPKATRDVIRDSLAKYRKGEEVLAPRAIHYIKFVDKGEKVFDYWDFKFPHPIFDGTTTQTTGSIRTPTGDIYTQCHTRTVYRRDKLATTMPFGPCYDQHGNNCRNYRQVYNQDYFKQCYPNEWEKKYNNYEKKQRKRVKYSKETFTRNVQTSKNKKQGNSPNNKKTGRSILTPSQKNFDKELLNQHEIKNIPVVTEVTSIHTNPKKTPLKQQVEQVWEPPRKIPV